MTRAEIRKKLGIVVLEDPTWEWEVYVHENPNTV